MNWCVFILLILFYVFLLWRRRRLLRRQKLAEFYDFIRGKDIVICGNSPEFDELFKKIKLTDNSVVVRFNRAINHYPRSSTDVYVYGRGMEYTQTDIHKLEKEYKFVIGNYELLLENNHIKDNIKLETPTTGFDFLTCMLTKQHLVKSITILGFNMGSSKSHGFDNDSMYYKHDRIEEPIQLKRLVDKYNVRYIR
jgi:hypothetical protein